MHDIASAEARVDGAPPYQSSSQPPLRPPGLERQRDEPKIQPATTKPQMKLSPECQERQALKVAYTKVASAIEVQLQLYSAAKPARGNRFREKQFRIGQRDVGKPCAI